MATGKLSIMAVDLDDTAAFRRAVAESVDDLHRKLDDAATEVSKTAIANSVEIAHIKATVNNGLTARVSRIDKRVWWIVAAVLATGGLGLVDLIADIAR